MLFRSLSFVVWLTVAVSGLFWCLKVAASGEALPPGVALPALSLATSGPLAKVMGDPEVEAEDEEAAPAPSDGRFKLLGVVGSGSSTSGMALIAVNDQPARALHVGSVVEGDVVLLSVGRGSASLGPRGGPVSSTLNLAGATDGGAAQPGRPGVRPQALGGIPGVALHPAAPQAPAPAAPEEDEE